VSPVALLAALMLQAAPGDPHVSASLSADRIAAGATTTLRIEVESRGTTTPEIGRPPLPVGLEVVGTSDFSQLRLSAPGRSVRATRRELVIYAAAPGVYDIPSIDVHIGAVRFRTEPLSLTVTGTAAPLRGSAGVDSPDAGITTLRLLADADTVYVGEQVIVGVEATFAEPSRYRQARPASFEPPATSGFWIQELPDPVTVTLTSDARIGRTVERQTFRRAYFPLTEGVLWFPPAFLNYEVRSGFLQPPQQRRIASDSVPLVVRPLPAQGRPGAFNGAVGRLDMTASLAPDRVGVGGSAVLTVELRGTGNIRGLPAPRLPEVAGLEALPPSHDAEVNVQDDVVGGVRRFRWLLVPNEVRTFVVPPLEYAYFDPELRAYVTLQSDSLVLQAMPVVAGQPADTALRPLRAAPGRAPADWALSPWFAAAQTVPLLLLGAVVLGRRRRLAAPPGADRLATLQRSVATLDPARGADALAEAERLLREAADVFAGPGGRSAGPEALRQAGHPVAAEQMAALLADLQRARFAPDAEADEATTAALLRRASALMASVTAARRRGRTASGAAGAILLLVLASAGVAGAAEESPDAWFERGILEYESGDVVAAAASFHQYARLRPSDPAGWYNHGLAAHAAGDPGRAVWAWLRSARLAPRDPDIRHNVLVAAGPAALTAVVPPDRLGAGERAVAGAAAWWLLVAGFAVALLRRRRAALLLAGVPAVPAAGTARRRRQRRRGPTGGHAAGAGHCRFRRSVRARRARCRPAGRPRGLAPGTPRRLAAGAPGRRPAGLGGTRPRGVALTPLDRRRGRTILPPCTTSRTSPSPTTR
jgi:hypothetical protein